MSNQTAEGSLDRDIAFRPNILEPVIEHQCHIASPWSNPPNRRQSPDSFFKAHGQENVVRKPSFFLCTTDILQTLKFTRRYTAGSECATELLSTLGNAETVAPRSNGNPVLNIPRCFSRELLSDYGSRQKVSQALAIASTERHRTDLPNRRSQRFRDAYRSR